MKITPALLAERFAAGFERRLCELARLADAADAEGLRLAFHSLAGIGGTYGRHDITELAREGEVHCAMRDLAGVRRVVAELLDRRDGWSTAA